jgi:hypothetical protein
MVALLAAIFWHAIRAFNPSPDLFRKMSNIDRQRRNQREHTGAIAARPGIYR